MTPENQRIAIAKACGWKPVQYGHPARACWEDPRNRLGVRVVFEHLPDYLNDLNAMHEAEKCLPTKQIGVMAMHLSRVVGFWGINNSGQFLPHEAYMWHATAAQRAEAFLKTLGLWTED